MFEVGDVVRLKSGGPMMTVGRVRLVSYGDDDVSVSCYWIDSHGVNHNADYDGRMLTTGPEWPTLPQPKPDHRT